MVKPHIFSLFDYVVHELGYTAAAAWRRIKAMRLCSATNGARELLQDGKLNLSNAAQLQNLFERSDRNHGRPAGSHGTGGGPDGAPRSDGSGESAPAAAMRADGSDRAPAAGPVLDAAAREELVKQAAGKSTREVQQMVAEVDPELARTNDRVRALGGGRWELKATIDAECRHGLEKLQMLLSHTDPHLTLGGLVARLVRDGLDRHDPARPPRSRRSGGRGSVVGERSASRPAQGGTETVQRSVPRAKGGTIGRRSEVGDDASSATVWPGVSGPSAPKRHVGAEPSSTASAAAPKSGGHTASAAKHQSESELGRAGRAVAAAKRGTAAERGGDRFPTSAANRLGYGAEIGAVGPAVHSPALQRHLAALSCFRAWPGSRSRYIPTAVRREVWRRDQGCCSYVDRHSGRRCGSRYRLEIDHIVPFALGGGTELSNLRLHCEAHHRLRHAQHPHAHRELAD